ncbi:MAG: hypothetical protein ACUVX9_08210 [Anaerolineae bacterium]
MAEPTQYAQISRVDVDRLYAGQLAPESWLELEVRVIELLERGEMSTEKSRAMVQALRRLSDAHNPVPPDAGELYLLVRPVLETLPGGYG